MWSALRMSDGTVLVGSDVGGAVMKVTDKDAKKLASIDGAIAVVALAAEGNTVYAGAMPGDKLWKIDVGTGKATAVATLKGIETIWSLGVGTDGTVYAGTGPDGKLFSIKGTTAKELYDTDDKRVTASRRQGRRVCFGTSERALVFRYDRRTARPRGGRLRGQRGDIAAVGGASLRE